MVVLTICIEISESGINWVPSVLLQAGLQTGTMGAKPQLLTDDSLQVGCMGANPQLMTDQFLQLG